VKKKSRFAFLLIIISWFICIDTGYAKSNSLIRLRILETTDLHARMLGYDYEKSLPSVEYGLERTKALIDISRKENPNTLLFDVGDALVGNSLGKYVRNSFILKWNEIHPVYKIMNALDYDAATVGNHEFNYGLDFLSLSLAGADFPIVNANIYLDDHNNYDGDDLNFFNPYTILNKEFYDTSGIKQRLKIGVIGLITPITADWDKEAFSGRLKIKNMRATLEHYIPIMKGKGADIIIVLAHAGLMADKGLNQKSGNSVYSLSRVQGVNAILYGHSHSLFPNSDMEASLKGINPRNGTINGVAAVQAGYWGNHLGIIDLELASTNGTWSVNHQHSSVKPIFRMKNGKKLPIIRPDPLIRKLLGDIHKEVQLFNSIKNMK
jgi:2',3'-cyclic-nucleotide 2'-phosphodiesterase / 3'-nucleotidase